MIQSLVIFHPVTDCSNEVRKLFDNVGIGAVLAQKPATRFQLGGRSPMVSP